ncbi:hypothetical protein K1X84_00230 [bacterium]|nr:hypothetical protein [bacterium]
MKNIVGVCFTLLIVSVSTAFAQDLAKLDPNTATDVLDKLGKEHYAKLVKDHEAKLAELEKAGTQIIKADITLTVVKPTPIAFAWPVSSGQKLADKSNVARSPYVMTLYPTKDLTGKDVAQKWQISYATGTIKAIE